ncbi:DUF6888 family protein [Chroococcidiopsis cubana]
MTSLFLPIFFVCFDDRTTEIFILAGEETEIVIDRNGIRRFL